MFNPLPIAYEPRAGNRQALRSGFPKLDVAAVELLAQARERVADRALWNRRCQLIAELECRNNVSLDTELRELGKRIDADCIEHLKKRRLIAYGRRGAAAAARLIKDAEWPALTAIDWERSAAADGRPGGFAFSDVRVFPPLLAPCRVDLLAGHSLAEAFSRCVLEDPEVATWAAEATRLSPHFEPLFVKGRCHVYGVEEWPVAFERWSTNDTVHPDPAKRSMFAFCREPDPLELVIAAEALTHRYHALMSMLQRGELEGRGLPTPAGAPEVILRSIWSHEDFHFHATTGDVLQHRPSKAMGRVETSSASYKACLAWLVEIMRASPTIRTESSTSLWKTAKQKWPDTVSHRSFLAARAEAVRISGAAAWAAAGAPRKSPQP